MDKKDYMSAAYGNLLSNSYKIVEMNRDFPVDLLQARVKKGLRELIRRDLMKENEMRKFVLSNPCVPSFSCLPKIHKEGNKIRPVVSDVNSPTSKISQWLTRKFRGYKRHESFSVKNSLELAREIEGFEIGDNEVLVSFDVESLYPSVPLKDAKEAMRRWVLEQDISDDEFELVIALVEIVMEQRWLEFYDTIFEQKEGLSIGNPLSSKLAELFMGELETEMSGESWFPRFWRRYVDDVIAIVNKEEVQGLLQQLNKRHTKIKFTVEVEQNESIPFLDTRLIRENGKIRIDVYRKPTDKPLCIPFESHHDIKHRLASFESFCFRVWNLPLSDERRKIEIEYILEMARLNGYEKEQIKNISHKHEMKARIKSLTTHKRESRKRQKQSIDRTGKTVTSYAVLPYYQPVSGRVKNVLSRNGINVAYNNRGTLKDLLGCVKKQKPDEHKSGIYRIECQDCAREYRGQTKRRLKVRDQEHARAVKNRQMEKSSVARHCCGARHEKGRIQLIQQVSDPRMLDSYESLYIAVGENLMNEGEPPVTSKLFKFGIDKKKKKYDDDERN